MPDLNDDDLPSELPRLLEAAEANAETDFELEFCADMRARFDQYGGQTRLTEPQLHKLRCIAEAGGFWERRR